MDAIQSHGRLSVWPHVRGYLVVLLPARRRVMSQEGLKGQGSRQESHILLCVNNFQPWQWQSPLDVVMALCELIPAVLLLLSPLILQVLNSSIILCCSVHQQSRSLGCILLSHLSFWRCSHYQTPDADHANSWLCILSIVMSCYHVLLSSS